MSPGEARTVLYVEDNPSNVQLMRRILARRPEVRLVVAVDGASALELAREVRPSLVLLDLHLPDLPGEEVLRRLRADPRTARTPVVVLSADAMPGQAERLTAIGADGYLAKPFDLAGLLAVIDAPEAQLVGSSPDRPDPAPASAVLDPEMVASLHDLSAGTEEGRRAIQELVASYLEHSRSRLAALEEAARAGDLGTIRELAHSLAGSSANLGAHLVGQGCRTVEGHARDGELGEARAATAPLRDLLARAADALRAEFLDDWAPPRPPASPYG